MEELWKSEAEYQTHCFKWFDKNMQHQRGQLMLFYNNPPNAIVGSKLISMGLRRGASDFLYLISREIHFIELKIGYKIQSDDQIGFEKMVTSLGWKYHLCRSKLYGDIHPFVNLVKNLNQ